MVITLPGKQPTEKLICDLNALSIVLCGPDYVFKKLSLSMY